MSHDKICVLLCLLVLCAAFLPKANADTSQADANAAFQKGDSARPRRFTLRSPHKTPPISG